MAFECVKLLRNIGQFDSVSTGARLPLTQFSLIYAENGRGKTTLASVLRSLSTNEPALINDRRRLGATDLPHIVLTFAGKQLIFENGQWTGYLPHISVFDDAFVAENVCSGITVEVSQRQNLHELILGSRGVTLNATLQTLIARIEQHNRDLRAKSGAIPQTVRGALTVDAFCALSDDPAIDVKLREAKRNLAAAQAADAIRQRAGFLPLSLPGFDVAALNVLLARSLPDVEAAAVEHVRKHLRGIGRGGEAWISDGMSRVVGASKGKEHKSCPFCAQDLIGSPLIEHYQAYFSESYGALKAEITRVGQGLNVAHGGDVLAAFERAIRVTTQTREFWHSFTDVPDIDVNTAAIARVWTEAREAVLTTLRAKAIAPLEHMALSAEAVAAIDAYNAQRTEIAGLSDALRMSNHAIAIVKEHAAVANIVTLAADLAKLTATKARYEGATASRCADFLAEKTAKAETEALRVKAREALDQYRHQVFPAYETAIITIKKR